MSRAQVSKAGKALSEEERILSLSAMPIYIRRWSVDADFNSQLARLVCDGTETNLANPVSGRGNKRTKNDLRKVRHPAIEQLNRMAIEHATRMTHQFIPESKNTQLEPWTLSMWGNVNPAGSRNLTHNHHDNGMHWSGVYYVDVGDLAGLEGGELVIEESGGLPLLKNGARRDLKITPENGMMIMFPSVAYHRVEPHTAEKHRISIAFDLKSPSLVIPDHVSIPKANWRWRHFGWVMRWVVRLENKWSQGVLGSGRRFLL